MKDNCNDFINNPYPLLRSKDNKDSNYSYVNPKLFYRNLRNDVGV